MLLKIVSRIHAGTECAALKNLSLYLLLENFSKCRIRVRILKFKILRQRRELLGPVKGTRVLSSVCPRRLFEKYWEHCNVMLPGMACNTL